MSDQAEVIEDDAEEDAYVLDPKSIAAILYAVDIEDQAKLTELTRGRDHV